jgi:hypothetical protein
MHDARDLERAHAADGDRHGRRAVAAPVEVVGGHGEPLGAVEQLPLDLELEQHERLLASVDQLELKVEAIAAVAHVLRVAGERGGERERELLALADGVERLEVVAASRGTTAGEIERRGDIAGAAGSACAAVTRFSTMPPRCTQVVETAWRAAPG